MLHAYFNRVLSGITMDKIHITCVKSVAEFRNFVQTSSVMNIYQKNGNVILHMLHANSSEIATGMIGEHESHSYSIEIHIEEFSDIHGYVAEVASVVPGCPALPNGY